jgi:hypothetical protein
MSENFFDDALRDVKLPAVDGKASQQRRWEHRVVGQLLTHYGLKQQAAALAQTAAGRSGVRGLTFAVFKEAYPTFPMWLACHKVPYVHELTVAKIVQRFTREPLWQTFEKAEADAPVAHQEGRFGLVFEWLKVWPTAILHNDYHALQRGGEWAFHFNWAGTDPPQRFAVQSFASFLDSLPWTPP